MEVILQNLCFPNKEICEVSELYHHQGEEGVLDLDGYFNLFYIEKHRKFTAIEELELEITAVGYASAALMHDRDEIGTVQLKSHETKHRIAFPYDQYDKGVFWLRLYPDQAMPPEERNVSGGYIGCLRQQAAGQIPEATDKPAGATCAYGTSAQIAVAICTYKREGYVLRNLTRMTELFEREPGLAAHYHVFVVDNGQTLADREDMQKLLARAGERIRLIPNRNTGGTGGFTRGMEEAIARKEELGLTHLMLLDDDAVFDPDLFIRLYGLLATLRDAYHGMTVGGSLLLEDMPYIQHSSGEWLKNMRISNPHPALDLRQYDQCVRKTMTEADENSGLYCGWWCCTYSMEVIRQENLPLPLFIRWDDIQFGVMHADQGIVFLNGIGVWHGSFELSFSGVKQYYNTRNYLITAAILEQDNSCGQVIRYMTRQISGPLLSFRYAELHLVYQGILDFFKGPEWLCSVDAVKLNNEIAEAYRSEISLKPLQELLGEEKYRRFATQHLTDEVKQQEIHKFHKRGQIKGRWWQYLTLNGWILPAKKKTGLFCIADTPWKLYRCGQALLYEPDTAKGCYAVRKPREMFLAALMVCRLSVLILTRFQRVSKAYRRRMN